MELPTVDEEACDYMERTRAMARGGIFGYRLSPTDSAADVIACSLQSKLFIGLTSSELSSFRSQETSCILSQDSLVCERDARA